MFLDTSFNSLATVLKNVYTAFVETGTKMWTYARCLPTGKQPGTKLLIKTISDLMELAFVLMKSKAKNEKNVGYKCAVSKIQVEWLATNAFRAVLQKRQSGCKSRQCCTKRSFIILHGSEQDHITNVKLLGKQIPSGRPLNRYHETNRVRLISSFRLNARNLARWRKLGGRLKHRRLLQMNPISLT
ncbi:hypothetical protein BGZ60DRAFT_130395 [Tricladium varicosporioides]|nr:hypothetical protein BGZ60DRAFT_130395 [Hymenoscyphus varicosporioides]